MPIKNPSERAAASAYHRMWLRRAVDRTWEVQKTYGLVLGAVVGILIAGTQALLADINLPIAITSILVGVAVVLAVTYLWALWVTPPRVAWEAEHDDPDTVTLLAGGADYDSQGGKVGPSWIKFPTRGTHEMEVRIPDFWQDRRLAAIRLLNPPREEPIHVGDPVPIVLPVGFTGRGRLILRSITPESLLFGVERSHGLEVKAEVYFEDGGP